MEVELDVKLTRVAGKRRALDCRQKGRHALLALELHKRDGREEGYHAAKAVLDPEPSSSAAGGQRARVFAIRP